MDWKQWRMYIGMVTPEVSVSNFKNKGNERIPRLISLRGYPLVYAAGLTAPNDLRQLPDFKTNPRRPLYAVLLELYR